MGQSLTDTTYVSTRWYRAPEIIFRATNYDSKVDVFALGCVFAELYLGAPILPGSSEGNQLLKLGLLIG